MHAVVMRETGGPEVLSYEEAERPTVDDGEVLIAVRAAAVNPIDWKLRRGMRELPLPTVLGNDVSGTVEESRAAAFAAGDEVFGIAGTGGYAELPRPHRQIARKPAGVSYVQAAALPVSGLTGGRPCSTAVGSPMGRRRSSPAPPEASATSQCSSARHAGAG